MEMAAGLKKEWEEWQEDGKKISKQRGGFTYGIPGGFCAWGCSA
jgi:hypothetical protein